MIKDGRRRIDRGEYRQVLYHYGESLDRVESFGYFVTLQRIIRK